MRITVLSDNLSIEGLQSEWGLSFLIEHDGKRWLLDTGGSELFLENAGALGIDIADVDHAVLSHAHNDHSSGMEAFFRVNGKADFLVSSNAAENCWSGKLLNRHYIGLPHGVLDAYKGRIRRTGAVTEVEHGVWVIPHSAPCSARIARNAHLYVKAGRRFIPDDFSHEQSLVFETPEGLVIFNSCSHSGAGAVLEEVTAALPDRPVLAYFGGLHLFRMSDREVAAVADNLAGCGIGCIYTGHCTGDRAFGILKDRMGGNVMQFRAGMCIEI